jgi:hypothetical protein
MTGLETKSFDSPDEEHPSGRGKIDVVTLGGATIRRLTFQPGWRWSEDAKPTAKTELCEYAHLNVHIAGRLRVKLADGTESEFGPGELSLLPPGHDAWVVGDEPVVIIEQTPQ